MESDNDMGYGNKTIALSIIMAVLLLAGCDPAVTIHLTRKDSDIFACPDGKSMTYYVDTKYEDGKSNRTRVRRYDSESSVAAGYAAVSFYKISVVRFEVYCDNELLFKSPPITRDELQPQEDPWYFIYEIE